MIPIRPLPLDSLEPHDFGTIRTRDQMAAEVPPGIPDFKLCLDARKALAALIGSGPKQERAHFATFAILTEGIARLRDFAMAGDPDAMELYGTLVRSAVSDLGQMARRHPEIVRKWSRRMQIVPVLTGKNAGHRTRLARDLAAFDVGAESLYRVNPPPGRKAPDVSTAANVLADRLFAHLSVYGLLVAGEKRKDAPKWARMAAVLPAREKADSKAAIEKWVAAAWDCILDATAGHPEEHALLKSLGAKGARKAGLQTPRTRAANVRAEIRQTISEAMHGWRKRPPPPHSE